MKTEIVCLAPDSMTRQQDTIATIPNLCNGRSGDYSIITKSRGENAAGPSNAEGALIYTVDDDHSLTELYTVVLENKGYVVRAFNRREEVLNALRTQPSRPDLLITDYLGHDMPANWFIQCCRVLHPAMRILVASGFDHIGWRYSVTRPDRFILKPFTTEAFLQEVHVALTA